MRAIRTTITIVGALGGLAAGWLYWGPGACAISAVADEPFCRYRLGTFLEGSGHRWLTEVLILATGALGGVVAWSIARVLFRHRPASRT